MDEAWRFKAHELIRKQAIGLVESMGGELDLLIDVGYPTVDNDPEFTEKNWQLANSFMGKEHVQETEVRMGAEDFGYYTQLIPGCFFRLGVRNEEKGIVHQVHTPKFDIDERAIETGIGIMAWLGTQSGL
jgi:hippurate hydrolase